MVGNTLKTVKLHTNREEGKDLSKMTQEFIKNFSQLAIPTFAVFYSSSECLLARYKNANNFEYIDKKGKLATVNLKNVFEARIFNEKAELRWCYDNGNCIAVTLSETTTEEKFGGNIYLKNPQQYLFWGKISPTDDAKNTDWTEFAEARIGKFYVPIKTSSRACFEAIEYLKSFEDQDGNVAVIDERLTGISEVK